ncbi:MAG: murein biosynthesis integral membrane protein MurJ [Verrucomicrobiota bacterium]
MNSENQETLVQTQKSATKVSVAVFGSRILGLIREILLTAVFGPGLILDAFYAAFRIPNLLRDLFAEGALSSAFVTTFSKKLKIDGPEAAYKLMNLVMTSLALFMIGIVLLGIFFAPGLVFILNSGFDKEQMELTTQLTRLLFPFIGLVSLAALFMGLLNSLGSFGLPASASMVFNLVSILCGLVLGYVIDPQLGPDAIYGFAIGTVLGGAAQWLIQVPKALSFGYRPAWALNLKDPGLQKVMALMVPAIIGGAAVQVNVMVNGWFASFLVQGAITWLYSAFRLMQLPIGMFGVAFATVALPNISRHAAQKDTGAFRHELSHGLSNVFFLTVPAAVGLAVLAPSIIELIFERGRFNEADTAKTAHALQGYVIGLAAYSGIKLLAPAFYALDKPHVPLRVSCIGIVLNIIISSLVVFVLDWSVFGLALSTSMVAILNFMQLLFYMRRELKGMNGSYLLKNTILILFITFLMGSSVFCLQWFLQSLEMDWLNHFLGKVVSVGLLVCLGISVYFVSAVILRMPQMKFLEKLSGRFLKR